MSGLPKIVALNIEQIGSNAAQLKSTLDPNGDTTTFYYEYDITNTFSTSQQTATETLPLDAGLVPINRVIQSLIANTTYYYRLVATNSFGTFYGATLYFTTKRVRLLTPDVEDLSQRLNETSEVQPLWRDFNQFTPWINGFLYNTAVVGQSINNCFRIGKKQRFFNNGFGSQLDMLNFEINDVITEDLALTYMLEAMSYEPRAFLDTGATTITPDYDNYVIDVNAVFGLVNTNTNQMYSVDLPSLNRG